MQCNRFATISMPTQTDLRGEPVVVQTNVTVHDSFTSQGARYVMFSVRHDAQDSPISLSVESFGTKHGTIFTERIDHEVPNEINIWAHVADVPTDTPIELKVKVGSSDRGAFRLESLVMPFDRGYEPVTNRGTDVTAFSFTMLGVNKETGDVGGSSEGLSERLRIPGFETVALVAVLGAAAVLVRRRMV